MRTFLIIYVLGLFSILSFAQQFQLEATIEKNVRAIFDIDGDGICEYIADTNKVYDGVTHILKYTFPNGSYIYWDDEIRAKNPKSNFPHIDFNGDGKRELIIQLPGDQFIEPKVIIYDLYNSQTLFEFDPRNYEYIDKKGIALKRRDYCILVKDIYYDSLKTIFDESKGTPEERKQLILLVVQEYVDTT